MSLDTSKIGQLVRTWTVNNQNVAYRVKFTPNPNLIMRSINQQSDLRISNIETGADLYTITGNNESRRFNPVSSLISEDAKHIVLQKDDYYTSNNIMHADMVKKTIQEYPTKGYLISEDLKELLYIETADTQNVIIYYDVENRKEVKRFFASKLPTNIMTKGNQKKLKNGVLDFYYSKDKGLSHCIFDIENEVILKDEHIIGTTGKELIAYKVRDIPALNRISLSVLEVEELSSSLFIARIGSYNQGNILVGMANVLIDRDKEKWIAYTEYPKISNDTSQDADSVASNAQIYWIPLLNNSRTHMFGYSKMISQYDEFIRTYDKGENHLLLLDLETGELDGSFDSRSDGAMFGRWGQTIYSISSDDRYILKNSYDYHSTNKTSTQRVFDSGLIPIYIKVLNKDFPMIELETYSDKDGGYIDKLDIYINDILVETINKPNRNISYEVLFTDLTTGENKIKMLATDEAGMEISASEKIRVIGSVPPRIDSYIIIAGKRYKVLDINIRGLEADISIDKSLSSNLNKNGYIELVESKHHPSCMINNQWQEMDHIHTNYIGDKATERYHLENYEGFDKLQLKINSDRKGSNIKSYIEKPRQIFRYKGDLIND